MAVRDDDRFERLLGEYIDRLIAGESLDRDVILTEHPEMGPELLREIETFQDFELPERALTGAAAQPLGTLGDYTLRRQVGRGGMGVVYEAWQNSMDRSVALKVLPGAVAADDKACVRFMREAKTAGKLNHQNIVRVHGMGIEENTPYYAMEFVEGETLAQILSRLKDAEPEAETVFGHKDSAAYFDKLARAFAEVADGLQHAHSKGVVHRDIKPSNLIRDAEGHLRILDFGLARLEGEESLTFSGDVLGTPLYMSPEQARRRKILVDHRTDIYSLGSTLYEALSGRPPFRGKDHAETLTQIIEREPVEPRKLNARLPKDLETIMLKCLRKEPFNRYGTAEALAQDLRRFVRGDPIEARAQTRLERLPGLWRRHGKKTAIAAAVLLVVALAGFAALKSRSASRDAARARYGPRLREAVAGMPWSQPGLRRRVIDDMLIGGNQWLTGDWQLLAGPEGLERLRQVEGKLGKLSATVPEWPDAPYFRARALFLLDRTEEATAILKTLRDDLGFMPAAAFLREISRRDAALEPRPEANEQGESKAQDQWLSAYEAMSSGRWEEAVAAYNKLEENGSDLYLGADLELRLGRGYARLKNAESHSALGDPDAARRELRRALVDFVAAREDWPTFIEPALLLGKLYLTEGDPEGAEETFVELYGDSASKDTVAFWVAAVYRSVRDYEKSLAWAKMITQESVSERLQAAAYLRAEKLQEAIEAAKHAIDLNPNDVYAHVSQASALMFLWWNRTGPERKAVDRKIHELAKTALALAPDSVDTNSLYAVVVRDDRYIEAARRCDPGSPTWRIRLAFLRYLQGRQDEAERQLRPVLEALQHDETLHIFLGLILDGQRRFTEARKAFERAVELRPTYWQAIQHIGWTFVAEGDFEKALPYYLEAVRYAPERNAAHEKLAFVLWKLGDLNRALEAAIESLQIAPDTEGTHESFQGALEDRLAAILEKGGVVETLGEIKPVAGLEAILEFPEVDPLFLQTGSLLRLYACEGRDADRALEYAERAVEKTDRKSVSALGIRAQCHYLRGELQEALCDLKRIRAVGAPSRLHDLLWEQIQRETHAIPQQDNLRGVSRQ